MLSTTKPLNEAVETSETHVSLTLKELKRAQRETIILV